jgi:hypothetical protein
MLARNWDLCSLASAMPVFILDLVEQAHVLDRNHCLVGKGREQLDLLVGEGRDLSLPQTYCAEGYALSQQRYSQQSVLDFLDGGRWSLVAEFTEVESGKRSETGMSAGSRKYATNCGATACANGARHPRDHTLWL